MCLRLASVNYMEIESFWKLTEVFYQELAGSQFNAFLFQSNSYIMISCFSGRVFACHIISDI